MIQKNNDDLRHSIILETCKALGLKKIPEIHKWFFPRSYRLTYIGMIEMKKVYTSYEFRFNDKPQTRDIIKLSKINSPYYIRGKTVILFDDATAMMVQLYDSIERYLKLGI